MEIQSIGPGRSTVQRTYFFTSSNIQSRRGAEALRGSTRKKTVSMKMPAKLMPSAIKTPSWVNPREPARSSAMKPTAVVSAPKKIAFPSVRTASLTAVV